MKILINTTTSYVGGSIQVPLSVINELKDIRTEHQFYILIGQEIDNQIDQSNFPDNINFYFVKKSPASLKNRKKIVSELVRIENIINPDVVFTVFGPSYWRPKAKHILGFADGRVYNQDSITHQGLPLLKRAKMSLYYLYKIYYLKRDADYFVIETEDAKNKLSKVLKTNGNNIFVVGNTYSSAFNDEKFLRKENQYYIRLPPKKNNEFRLVYIAHNHPHKNIQIINDIIPLLADYNISFILTLDEKSYQDIFLSPHDKIINIGCIPLNSCPSVYNQCDALFAPTLLETFSASYPEAMKMNIPIMTSSYSFSKDICKDAALYFDPLDKNDVTKKITTLINNKSLQKDLIKEGRRRLQDFETAKSRAKKYINLCEEVVNEG